MKIITADYGMGNINSIANMVSKAGGSVEVSSDPEQLAHARKLILPGVGAFDKGMAALDETGIKEAIYSSVQNGSVILGICLGMQLLMDGSEEGETPGLGLIPGKVCRFPSGTGLKVPHMGWNRVLPKKDTALLSTQDQDVSRFYFVHSYFASCAEDSDVAAITHYGFDFVSAFSRKNIHGVQFHPEKSHRFGLELFRRFVDY